MTNKEISLALQTLRPGSQWTLLGSDISGLTWIDKITVVPSLAEVQQAIATISQQNVTFQTNITTAQTVIANPQSTTDQKVNAMITILGSALTVSAVSQTLPT